MFQRIKIWVLILPLYLIRRGQWLGLLKCHILIAANNRSPTSLNAQYLASTYLALKPLTQLIWHSPSLLFRTIGLFLEGHRLTAASEATVASLGDNEFGAALFTKVSLA